MFTIESYFYTFVNYFFLSYILLYIVFLFLYQSLAKKEITLDLLHWHQVFPLQWLCLSFYFFVICLVHLFSQDLLSISVLSGSVLGAEDTVLSKDRPIPTLSSPPEYIRKNVKLNKHLPKTYDMCQVRELGTGSYWHSL